MEALGAAQRPNQDPSQALNALKEPEPPKA